MARKMKTSEAIIAREPIPDEDGPEHCSVSVRKIDNGYVASHSKEGADGSYSHKEEFHQSRPKVEELLGKTAERPVREPVNHLKGAISLMNRKRT